MEFRALILIFCCALVCAAVEQKYDSAVKYEMGGKEDKENIKNLMLINSQDDSESGDGEGSGTGNTIDDTESSGSGSGEGMDNNNNSPNIIVTATTEKPKKTATKSTKTKSKVSSTVVDINTGDTTVKPRKKTTTKESNDPDDVEKPTVDPRNDLQRATAQNNDDVETGVNFTVGIIIGVVVGAILAILVIVFLVYRLRKKDEGSYSLDEPSSQAFIRDEKSNPGQGKEYFA